MLDILGREVQRGDVIAVANCNASGFSTYMRTRLGIVCNILPERKYQKGSWQYKRILDRINNRANTSVGTNVFGNTPLQITKSYNPPTPLIQGPDEYTVMEKITFLPFGTDFFPASNKISKAGVPLIRRHCTNSFLLVDVNTLTQEWLDIYNKVKVLYQI